GTTNAIRGLPLYCVSLAVTEGPLSAVRTGLVRNVPTGDVYLGRLKAGAFLNGTRIRSRRFDPENAILSPTLGEYARPEALHLAQTRYNVRSLGSAALEMCFVAQGALDLYFFAPERMRVTDIAASSLIVREAGGLVRNARGDELEMETSLAPRTSVVAAGSAETLRMLEVFH
ncbi:MAG TPA: inositol monophosphatase family protein, partial [Candidatus Thermoplasmatota archaeon]|nr:inositol monophosphatase family protein [Candidatus Thermoplasmatota archaeon]